MWYGLGTLMLGAVTLVLPMIDANDHPRLFGVLCALNGCLVLLLRLRTRKSVSLR
jgi:hypothetical protein